MLMKDNYVKKCFKKIQNADAVYDIAVRTPTQAAITIRAAVSGSHAIRRDHI